MYLCRCTCGVEKLVRSVSLRSGLSKSCGDCDHFQGPGSIDGDGYRVLYRPKHPNATKRGAIGEHQLVMSEMLGRPLLPGENVHHRNGVRDDNRPENLELWTTSQPFGQRVEDKLVWAREIIDRYGRSDRIIEHSPGVWAIQIRDRITA